MGAAWLCVQGGVYEFRVLAFAFWGETCGVCVCMWGIRAGGWVMEGGYRRNTWLRKTVARERGVRTVLRKSGVQPFVDIALARKYFV